MDRKTHRGRLRGNAEFIEQSSQQRIVLFVEDDEAAVDYKRGAIEFDIVTVGVTSEAAIGLEQDDFMFTRQQPGTGHPGDARANHGDAHQLASSTGRRKPAGTGRSSLTRPTPCMALSTYHVMSISHQRWPCRAEPGK